MSGRILIADDVATNRIVLKVKLTSACYEVSQAASVDEVLVQAEHFHPDLILLGQTLQGGGGIEASQRLKDHEELRDIPVVIISPNGNRAERLNAVRAGAEGYLTKPLDESTLLAMIRNLMRVHTARSELARRQILAEEMGFSDAPALFQRQAHIALLPPTVEAGLMWRKALTHEMGQMVHVLTKAQALEESVQGGAVPDVFIIAANLPEPGDGLRLLSELQSRLSTRNSLIIFVDESNNAAAASMALDLGANAVLTGYFDAEEIKARLSHLLPGKFLSDRLRNTEDQRLSLAMTDPLTGLYNRRYAASYLDRLEAQSAKSGKGFALMLLDLDRFKSINDRFGHIAGDEVLIDVANRLRSNIREVDLLARFGGEEFLIAMPNTDQQAAGLMAERLRRVVGETPVWSKAIQGDIPVTLSIGVAVSAADETQAGGINALLQAADRALYASKAEGRNLVTFVPNAA